MCERELETEYNCNILTPTLTAITVFLFRSGLLNRGPGDQPFWVLVFSTATYLQLQQLNRGPEGPLYCVLALSTSSCLQLLNFLCTKLYNSSSSTFFLWASQLALIQSVHGQGYILIFPDWMHLLFTLVYFLFWQPGRFGGQYTTIIFKFYFRRR